MLQSVETKYEIKNLRKDWKMKIKWDPIMIQNYENTRDLRMVLS